MAGISSVSGNKGPISRMCPMIFKKHFQNPRKPGASAKELKQSTTNQVNMYIYIYVHNIDKMLKTCLAAPIQTFFSVDQETQGPTRSYPSATRQSRPEHRSLPWSLCAAAQRILAAMQTGEITAGFYRSPAVSRDLNPCKSFSNSLALVKLNSELVVFGHIDIIICDSAAILRHQNSSSTRTVSYQEKLSFWHQFHSKEETDSSLCFLQICGESAQYSYSVWRSSISTIRKMRQNRSLPQTNNQHRVYQNSQCSANSSPSGW